MKDTIPSVENCEAPPRHNTKILMGGRQWYHPGPWISWKIAASAKPIPPGLYRKERLGYVVYLYIYISFTSTPKCESWSEICVSLQEIYYSFPYPKDPITFSDDDWVYNHLLRKVFRFHYHSQKVIGSLGIHNVTQFFCWIVIWIYIHPPRHIQDEQMRSWQRPVLACELGNFLGWPLGCPVGS